VVVLPKVPGALHAMSATTDDDCDCGVVLLLCMCTMSNTMYVCALLRWDAHASSCPVQKLHLHAAACAASARQSHLWRHN
jgi:hypothetical protein